MANGEPLKSKTRSLYGNSNSATGGSRLERFLFEDDHDVTRAIVNFLSSKAAVRRFVSCGLIGLGLLLAVFVSLGAGLGLRQKEAGDGALGPSLAGPTATAIDELSPLVGDENAESSVRDSGAVSTFTEDRNYVFGSMLAQDRPNGVGAGGAGLTETLTARNNAGVPVQSAVTGGGGGGGGGAAPAGESAAINGTDKATAKIPDSGRTLGLLGFAFGCLIVGRSFQIYRHR